MFELYKLHRNDQMLLTAFDEIESATREAPVDSSSADPLRRARVALREEIRSAMVSHAESTLRASAPRSPQTAERLTRDDKIISHMMGAYHQLRHLQKKAAKDSNLLRSLPSHVARQVHLRVAADSQGEISQAAIVRAWSQDFLLGPDGPPWRNLIAEVERVGKELRSRAKDDSATSLGPKRSGADWRESRMNISKKR